MAYSVAVYHRQSAFALAHSFRVWARDKEGEAKLGGAEKRGGWALAFETSSEGCAIPCKVMLD